MTGHHVRRTHASAVATAVVGEVAARGDDPVVPAQLAEAHVEALLATERVVAVAVDGPTSHAPGGDRLCVDDQVGSLTALEQHGLRQTRAARAVHQQPEPRHCGCVVPLPDRGCQVEPLPA